MPRQVPRRQARRYGYGSYQVPSYPPDETGFKRDGPDYLHEGQLEATALKSHGIVELGRADYRAAAATFSLAIARDPNRAIAYLHRAVAYRELGDYHRANADFEEAQRLSSKDGRVLIRDQVEIDTEFAWFLSTCPEARLRDGCLALEYVRRAYLRRGYDEHRKMTVIAAVHAELGRFPTAVKWQRAALQLLVKKRDCAEARLCLEMYEQGKPYRMTVNPNDEARHGEKGAEKPG
jgi:tetratricopeptide (TPR) repeat protein